MGNVIGLVFFCVSYGFICYCAWRWMGLPYKDSTDDASDE